MGCKDVFMYPHFSSSGNFKHLERDIIKPHTHTNPAASDILKSHHWLDLELCKVGQSVPHTHENLLEKF